MRGFVAYSSTLLRLLKVTPALSLDGLFPALTALSPVTILAIWGYVPTKRAVPTIALRDLSTQRSA